MNTKLFLAFGALLFFVTSPIFASDVVYVVNSYVHNSPLPDWSTVDMLDGDDLSIMDTVSVGAGAHSVAVSPNGREIWVTCTRDNTISVIDAYNLDILRNIDLGDVDYRPMGIAFTPDGNHVYVTFESMGRVGVFVADTYELLSTIFVGDDPGYVLFTPDGRKAYVVNVQNPQVTVIRTSDSSVIATLDFGGVALQDAIVSPRGDRVYVSNMDQNQIEVIRTSDDTILAPIHTTQIHPRGISISSDGNYLFVGHYLGYDSTVNMLRLSDNRVVFSAEIPSNPRRIVLGSEGDRIYVSEHNGDECYAFNVAGESLTFASVVDLNTVSGFNASPVGLAIRKTLEIPRLILLEDPHIYQPLPEQPPTLKPELDLPFPSAKQPLKLIK